LSVKNYYIQVRVSKDTRLRIQKKAKTLNRTVSDLMTTFMTAFLEERLKIIPSKEEKELIEC
jgi:antitoxin component of RelBE/YafQ-DinJ toxin-antitoxin module